MTIDYKKIDLQELDRLYFLHGNDFSLICDGDTKQVIIIKEEI